MGQAAAYHLRITPNIASGSRCEGQEIRKYARVSLTRQFDTADLLRRGETLAWYALPAIGMLYFLCLRQRESTLGHD